MKTERRTKSFPAMARRIMALTLSLWLLAAGLLTWAVAEDFRSQIESNISHISAVASRNPRWVDDYPENLPGSMEVGMIDYLGYPYLWLHFFVDPLLPIVGDYDGVGSDDWLWGKWDLYFGFEVGSAYYQEEDLLIDSGNYFTFVYTTQENWFDQNLEPVGRSYVDLDTLPAGATTMSGYLQSWPMGEIGLDMFLNLVRMTGYFEGNQFHPVTIDRGDTKYGSNPTLEQMCALDCRENLLWNPIMTEPVYTDRALETIYVWHMGGIRHDTGPVTVEGIPYDSLEDLAAADRENRGVYESSNLLESVYIWRSDREDQYGAFTYALAVRCWPLQYAALRLVPFYLISLAVTILLLLLLLRSIRRNLTGPLEELTDKISRNAYMEPDADWAEPRALQEYYESARQTIHENETQIAQLDTALEYAKNAEESRRQLVSNITHELKTPLAVIHSYAEGLQADIAAEKKEQYLKIILEESEKMDAMVLQMLDLSRLEAGRVRLQTDTFPLLAVTEAVIEKIQPLAESRGLSFRFDLADHFDITADEARLEQVITNLVSNAVKYAQDGTQISVKVFSNGAEGWFLIDNVADHLSDEALEKVWDSFYRADASRSTAGTGLGLAIVRSIVELHRGTCVVRNTMMEEGPGVEFGFCIPL